MASNYWNQSGAVKHSGLEGVAALDKQLAELGDKKATASVLRSGVGSSMRKVAKAAKAKVPEGKEPHRTYKGRLVAPGFARRSIRVVTRVDKTGEKAYALLGVRKEAFYALQFIELGTAYIPAQPWLVPAFEESRDESMQQIGKSMRKRIDKIAAKRAAQGRTPPSR